MAVQLSYYRVNRKGFKKLIKFNSITEAAEETGIPYMTLRQRIKLLEWPLVDALTTPVRPYERA